MSDGPHEGDRERLMRAAMAAAERGWHVFPLRPGDKRPAIRDWQMRATTDPGAIDRCWRAGSYNVGIACGPSELVVVDLDLSKGEARPGIEAVDGPAAFAALARESGQTHWCNTFTVTTATGGTHLYYRAPEADLRNTAGRLAPFIDTRAEGGYVVAPGSVINGQRYAVANHQPVAVLPAVLERRLRAVPALSSSSPIHLPLNTSRYFEGAVRRHVHRVETAAPGTRNDTLNAAAFSLGRLVGAGLLPADSVGSALTHAARTAGLEEREIDATIRSGLAAGAERPREFARPTADPTLQPRTIPSLRH
jgi:hypothetical protein